MTLTGYLFIVCVIVVVLEYLTGKIYVLKRSSFADRDANPDIFWKSFSWHIVLTIVVAISMFT